MASAHIVISGVPATGKSTFGRWLQRHCGFAHIDLENGGLHQYGIDAAWARVARLPSVDIAPLVAALDAIGRPAVIDWGYPPDWLPLVQALHAAGVTAWWFDGDRTAARERFVARGTVPVAALDVQMRKIEAAWPRLVTFYSDRIVRTIAPDGSFMTPAAVAQEIVQAA